MKRGNHDNDNDNIRKCIDSNVGYKKWNQSCSSDSITRQNHYDDDNNENRKQPLYHDQNRRSIVRNHILMLCYCSSVMGATQKRVAQAAVGTLPEFANTDCILQGITLRTTSRLQYDSMIQFLKDGFNFRILRQQKRKIRRNSRGSGRESNIDETWLGYGPEQLSIPSNFVLPVSSWQTYGGHSSIHLVYEDTNLQSNNKNNNHDNDNMIEPYYNMGDETLPGNNIAYIQLGVPGYRISQIISNNGMIQDAYGYVNVIAPVGVLFRGIVGIVPDPIMLIAIHCSDVVQSQIFYESLGFTQQEYPYARPSRGQGPFEPSQPSSSIYLSTTSTTLGILLLPYPPPSTTNNNRKNQSNRRTLPITTSTMTAVIRPNPVVESLNIVYSTLPNSIAKQTKMIVDPSGITLRFQSVEDFDKEEKQTRR
jgi:hypothetical protein